MRMIITDNSGSGKTGLAKNLAAIHHCQIIHRDHIFWPPGGFSAKRSPEVVDQMIADAKNKNSRVVEGAFGELAEKFMDRAQCFVWLDIDWPLCRDRRLQRGCEASSHMNRQQSQEDLRELIEWASHYDQRENARSYAGHKKLMEQFEGKKIHLCSEADTVRLVEQSHSICKVNQ